MEVNPFKWRISGQGNEVSFSFWIRAVSHSLCAPFKTFLGCFHSQTLSQPVSLSTKYKIWIVNFGAIIEAKILKNSFQFLLFWQDTSDVNARKPKTKSASKEISTRFQSIFVTLKVLILFQRLNTPDPPRQAFLPPAFCLHPTWLC